MDERIKKILNNQGGIIKTSDAIAKGISKMTLTNYVRSGQLERVAHGIYADPGEIRDDMYLLQLRYPKLIFSHETALWLNGLTDRDPLKLTATLKARTSQSEIFRKDCRIRYSNPAFFELGLSIRQTEFGHEVRCYNSERTVCDMIRHESRVGIEEMIDGLKNYVKENKDRIPKLMSMAKILGIEKKLQRFLWVLL